MPIGRSCIEHYRQLSRYCVFSHDEMVCNMALKAATIDFDLAAVLTKEMKAMVEKEEELWSKVKRMVSHFTKNKNKKCICMYNVPFFFYIF